VFEGSVHMQGNLAKIDGEVFR